jgi:antitoxin CptB
MPGYIKDPSMVDSTELNRLFWHSRRGMLELDVLLVPFVREVYSSLDADDQARYRKLLECEDQDMFGWFMQRGEPEDADLKRMVRMILDRVQPK